MQSPRRRFETRPVDRSTTPQMARLVVGLVLVMAFMFIAWQKAREQPGHEQPAAQPSPAGDSGHRPVEVRILEPKRSESAEQADAELPRANTAEQSATGAVVQTSIKNLKIRDQNGKVVYQGTVELQDTLDRIARGERGSHGNDGSVFQNRERRLPVKPAGYYREWVHPTPKLRGPGPQRIVTGNGGEVYYTPDHYETFQRLDK